MNKFPAEARFVHPWRKYQQRVLDQLEKHLVDDHLHLIAPPGSGKTTLGLEVARRLDKPTLILTPSLAIRNQWIQRFCEQFLSTTECPDWISRDIKDPKFLTVSTYQSLHAACSGELEMESDDEEETEPYTVRRLSKSKTENLKRKLKEANIGTILVDEAHHLKNEWWKSLNSIKKSLNPIVVGLTATPPYDVTGAEWKRYVELNGPVDAEISVPELVQENNLCPHQDFIYSSTPTLDERNLLFHFRENTADFLTEIKQDTILRTAIETHPLIQDPRKQLDAIYSDIETYSSFLIYLGFDSKFTKQDHFRIIGDNGRDLPEFDDFWVEVLLRHYLFGNDPHFEQLEDHRKAIKKRLSQIGVLERKSINFHSNKKINTALNSSLSKLRSIENIVEFEHQNLGESLRMVVLTDYIRKEYLVNTEDNLLPLTKIGVMSIFEQLRRNHSDRYKMGVLTGSVVILPESARERLTQLMDAKQVGFSMNPLAFDKGYFQVAVEGKNKHFLVQWVTQIFEEGEVEILIGTKSLLGEGWDAPCINTLILASFVGSYVLSNQMRGRAIRTDRNNPDKTANIWHLVCVDHDSKNWGEDYDTLKRRFRTFVGLTMTDDPIIENGVNRMLGTAEKGIQLDKQNERMLARAKMRNTLKKRWTLALAKGVYMRENIRIPYDGEIDYQGAQALYYNKTKRYATGVFVSSLALFLKAVLSFMLGALRSTMILENFFFSMQIVGGIGLLFFGPATFKIFRLYLRYRDISKDLQSMGEALLATLKHMNQITTPLAELKVHSEANDIGELFCSLRGGTTFERSLFLKCMQELLSDIDTPRYLIERKSQFLKLISQKDYHCVPEIIAKRKAYVEHFVRAWNGHVGSCTLVKTNTVEGRKVLIQSRLNSMAAQFQDKSERINKWTK